MPSLSIMELIKASFIYKIIFILFIAPYEQSFIKKIVDKLVYYTKQSFIYKKTDAYFDKEPYFIDSKFYDKLGLVINNLNNIASKLNNYIFLNISNSFFIIKIKELHRKNFKYSICILLVFINLIVFISLELFIGLIILGIAGAIILLDYQKITYILALYPLVDYILRLGLPAFAGIWDELLLVLMFLVWGYKCVAYRNQDSFKINPLDLAVTSFLIGMTCVFIANSPNFGISLEGLRANIQYVIWFYVVFQLINTEKDAKNICLVFVGLVGLMAIHGVYQYVIGVEMPASWVDNAEEGVRTRVFSILTSPNILGSLMTLALPLCLGFASISKTLKDQTIFYFLALMMVLTLIFTFSRGAWIGFALAITMYVFLKDKRLFIPVIILGVLALFLVPSIGDRISYMLSEDYIRSSLKAGRLVRWITGLEILQENLIFGVGHGHFGGAVAMNNKLSYTLGNTWHATYYMDNYYLKIAVETGIFGFLFFVTLMYQIVINGLKTIRITKNKEHRELEIGLLSGIFGVILHNFVENVFEVPMMTSCFWLLVAVLMSFWHINYYANNNNN